MHKDTPEPDAHLDSLNDDWDVELASITNLARKLERERNDLRKAVNGLCEHLGVSPANTTLLAVQVLRIERERDEWKAEAERLKNACDKWSESEMLLQLTGNIETSDIINGLLHTAEDHPCCKGTLLAAASLLLEYSKSLNQIYLN